MTAEFIFAVFVSRTDFIFFNINEILKPVNGKELWRKHTFCNVSL